MYVIDFITFHLDMCLATAKSGGEAVDIMDFVEQHEAQNLADAGHGLQQM